MNQKLPAYPLFVKDPFFSIWSKSDVLNEDDTMFWNGKKMRTYGLVFANGKCYSFLGNLENTVKLKQTEVNITLFSTDYKFTCEEFDLSVSFVSPLPLNDLETLSCPVCFMTYEITAKCKLKDASVSIVMDEEALYSREAREVKGGVHRLDNYELVYFGLRRQMPLSHSYDSVNAEWGYYYLSGENCMYCSKTALNQYIFTGRVEYSLNREERQYIFASNKIADNDKNTNGKFMVAFDDLVSIFYFGDYLKGYYFRNNKNIFTAIQNCVINFTAIIDNLKSFEQTVKNDAKDFGEEYNHIINAAYRQAVAAHKLVEDRDGNLLFLSKECHSNGCIGTVDITYPSTPLFMLYNPKLVEAMIRPIFKFAKMPIWKYEYAPHDVGTYPYCLGQTYGIKENDDKYHAKSIFFIPDKREESYPMFYQFPGNCDIYTEQYQMPIEECSNMLIVAAACLKLTKNTELPTQNLTLLKQWADYLVKNGLIPSNQPCTDDFASKLDKNTNLSIKACVGIASYSIILKLLNMEGSSKYMDIAKNYAAEWEKMTEKFKHAPLTFDSNDETFSLKYNIAYDLLFETNLFSNQTVKREIDCYMQRLNAYGIPLDNRNTYSKSDWIMWISLFGGDEEKKKIFHSIYKFLTESESRVPFTDFYDTISGKIIEFQNRTVQGAMFMPILKQKGLLKID